MDSLVEVPCPDPECEGGEITIYNAYAPDPLQGEKHTCDTCKGLSFIEVFVPELKANEVN